MKNLILLSAFCCLCGTGFSQGKIVNKFSSESLLSYARETNFGSGGLEIGQQLNYMLIDRFGFYTSIGGYHSLFSKSILENGNSSSLLLNLNVFGDIISTSTGHRLRIAAGGTYFNGVVAFDQKLGHYDSPVHKETYYHNNLGLNMSLSYHYPLCGDKWYLGANLKAYSMLPFNSFVVNYVSFGFSAGYNF